jgi:hypothetical protein
MVYSILGDPGQLRGGERGGAGKESEGKDALGTYSANTSSKLFQNCFIILQAAKPGVIFYVQTFLKYY